MSRINERTVLFADLRGSTALFESLGNAVASALVTQCVKVIGGAVNRAGGQVVKTLGDGLMAVFPAAPQAMLAAAAMHEQLEDMALSGQALDAPAGLRELRLQVGVAHGEVVEIGQDFFGDAVNVAARLLDHAGDDETLVTADVFAALPAEQQGRFRHLDRLVLRGRAEPVSVHITGGRRVADTAATQFGDAPHPREPNAVCLVWQSLEKTYRSEQTPLILGRSPQVTFCIQDSRVSRSHARIDWHGGSFQLSDLSYNGTYVRFGDGEIVSLRRGACILHGRGTIGLGGSPIDPSSAVVRFEVLSETPVFAEPKIGDTHGPIPS